MSHKAIMQEETIQALGIKDGGAYIDATFGRGGHTKAILNKGGIVLAIDKDPAAFEESIIESENLFKKCASFSRIGEIWEEFMSPMKADGVLFDLGVSSPQLDIAEYGFSFQKEGPLDMRFGKDGISAMEWLEKATTDEMEEVFENYGEEKHAKKIAAAIEVARKKQKIETTLQLAKIIENCIGKKEKKHPATRVFQAIRIKVNDEIEELKKGLSSAKKILKNYGRIAVISFHSLEDKVVKEFFMQNCWSFRKICMPKKEEIRTNVRSRSAKLRWAEKCE